VETRTAYITDIEGQWERLATFARGNPWVALDDRGELQVAPGVKLVFGGDAMDRGPAGRRVLRALLSAHARHPGQVVLLAGNRDLNKLRLARELRGHPPSRMPPAVCAASRGEQLRWIFAHTMGAGAAFDHRSTELQAAGLGRGSDDDVVDSFAEDVAPGGLLRRYLEAAVLAHREGGTLFVHGGVTEENLGRVPGLDGTCGVGEWPGALNAWYRAQLAAVDSGEQDAEGRPAWFQLMAYQAPVPGTRWNQQSVVYGRTADPDNNPQLPGVSTRERLLGAGIHRVVVGHTPNGDTPSVLRAGGFEQVVADTSHARLEDGAQLYLEEARFRVEGWTVLDGGERRRVTFSVSRGDGSPIGHRLASTGELVKGQLEGGDYLLFKYGPGYATYQRAAKPGDVEGAATER
jgi:hypothetical protein